MSTYDPYYYPYFSARPELPPSYQKLQHRIDAMKEEENYRNIIQSNQVLRRNEELQNYQLERCRQNFMINAQIDIAAERQFYEAELQARISRKKEEFVQIDYRNKIEELRIQRQMQERVNARLEFGNLIRMPQVNADQKYLSDDELIRYYESGSRVQQYQQQLKERLDPYSKKQTILINQSQKNRNANRNDEKQGTVINRQSEHKNSNRNSRNNFGLIEDEAFKRSYIQQLRTSKNGEKTNDTLLQKYKKDNVRGQTMNLRSKYDPQSPFQSKYEVKSKKDKNKLNKTMVTSTKKKNKKASMIELSYQNQKQRSTVFNEDAIRNGLKNIELRLKLSKIVYKDSNLRNDKHEIDHLFNTFQKEITGRKVIKNKLNNHPIILKRFNIVVESR